MVEREREGGGYIYAESTKGYIHLNMHPNVLSLPANYHVYFLRFSGQNLHPPDLINQPTIVDES